MTLQYRTRDLSDDRRWQQRVRLSDQLLMEAVDDWCRGDGDFPLDSTVAALLYLFSPRCSPFSTPERNLRQHLSNLTQSPAAEYAATWPSHDQQTGAGMIASLTGILAGSIDQWSSGAPLDTVSLNQCIVDAIVAHKYVTFHHRQSTRRDGGGFHAHW